MTTISVAMATYNGARHIREQLESLVAQTTRPEELVVTDDCSSDSTLSLVQTFARSAPFSVRAYRNGERLGYRANFMKCADLCRGDLIAFCDQDDVWLDSKLAIQREHFTHDEVLMSCHSADLIDSSGASIGRSLGLFPCSNIYSIENTSPFAFAQGFTQTVRRELLAFSGLRARSVDIADCGERMAHDKWFFFLAIIFGLVRYDSRSLVYYRQHQSNTSGHVPTEGRKMLNKFSDRRAEYDRLVLVWRNRLEIIDALAAGKGKANWVIDNVESKLERASELYYGLCISTERRRDLYNEESLAKRLALFGKAVRKGDYGWSNPWLFSPLAAIRDLTMLFAGSNELPFWRSNLD